LAADCLIAREYLSSAQMVSETPSEPLPEDPPALPQPARNSISPTINRARWSDLRACVLLNLSAAEGFLSFDPLARSRNLNVQPNREIVLSWLSGSVKSS
jgi:hypothetical protein